MLFRLCVFLLVCAPLSAEHWPQFRGPNGDAVVTDSFPQTWDTRTHVRWKVPLDGEGWSAPVVWGNRLFLTAAVMTSPPAAGQQPAAPRRIRGRRGGRGRNNLNTATYRWEIRCYDTASGRQLWTHTCREGKPPLGRHLQNSYATETPVTDGQHVYAWFGMTGLYCLTTDGTPVWKKDLGNFQMRHDWGTASSPVLHDGRLYLQMDSQEQSFLTALDAATGDEIWKTDREEPSHYSSPVVWNNSLRTEIVTAGQHARSYDPDTGQLLWELDLEGGRSSASPLPAGDRLYVGSELRNRGGDDDGGGLMFAVAAGGSGRLNADNPQQVVWRLPKSGIQMASPVLCEGHLYLFERRRGVLHCINADTGKMAYEKRVSGARAFWSSPWVSGGKVYCLDDDGTTHVFAGGASYQVAGTNRLEEQVWSSPAIADGALYVRTTESLFCIGQ